MRTLACSRRALKVGVPAIAASLVLAACGSSSSNYASNESASAKPAAQSSPTSSAIVKTDTSSTLGTILTDGQGMTLYRLSGEQSGKFICATAACTSVWRPLSAPTSATPSGEVGSLATVKRPGGTLQVTYKGSPLYTFAQDKRPGEANGQGIKDVGTWSAVRIGAPAHSTPAPASAAPAGSAPPAEPESGGGGYGY